VAERKAGRGKQDNRAIELAWDRAAKGPDQRGQNGPFSGERAL
jgi:hypothetical protein